MFHTSPLGLALVTMAVLQANVPAQAMPSRLPAAFVANQGQFDARARFVLKHGAAAAFFTRDGVLLRLDEMQRRTTLSLAFEGGEAEPVIEGLDPVATRFHYFVGEPDAWRTDVPGYSTLVYRGVAPRVDAVFRATGGGLEYDLVCASPAAASAVVIRVDGALDLALDAQGALAISTAAGVLRQEPPRVFAVDAGGARSPVECRPVILDRQRFAFELGACPPHARLVIDPVLAYATYLGGSSMDVVHGVALDSLGRAVLVGTTSSSDFPVGSPFDATLGFTDAFLVKLDASGSSAVFATFFGGDATIDAGLCVALDGSDQILIGGAAQGTVFGSGFPTTPGAFDTTHSGGTNIDGFVARFAASGQALSYSTLLGGSWTSVNGIAAGPGGTAYATGFTFSPSFPTTAGAADTAFDAGFFACDAFVTRISADGGSLVYSTYVGADNVSDVAKDVAVDAAGTAYVVGSTPGLLPGSPGVLDATVAGAFVIGVAPTGASLTFATGLGSAAEASAVALLGGDVLVTGHGPAGLLVSPGALDGSFNGGSSDAFVVRTNDTGTVLRYGTYLGGGGMDQGLDLAVDGRGNAHVVGGTQSADFPTTPGAPQATLAGTNDAFAAKVDPKGAVLLYATYLGGSASEAQSGGGTVVAPAGIAVDAAEAALVAGFTDSGNFPVTGGAFDVGFNGGTGDGFAAKAPTRTCATNATSMVYGTGKAGSNGVPMLAEIHLPYVAATTSVRITQGRPFTPSLMLLGISPATLPFDGGMLLVNPVLSIQLPPFDAAGTLTLTATLPDSPALCGKTLYHQVIFADPAAAGFYHTAQSNGLARTFGS